MNIPAGFEGVRDNRVCSLTRFFMR